MFNYLHRLDNLILLCWQRRKNRKKMYNFCTGVEESYPNNILKVLIDVGGAKEVGAQERPHPYG